MSVLGAVSLFGWCHLIYYTVLYELTCLFRGMYGAVHKRYSVAKLIKAVATELSRGMWKHNSHKQKPQWFNVDRIPGLGGAF